MTYQGNLFGLDPDPAGKPGELVEDFVLHHQTDDAVLVSSSDVADEMHAKWLGRRYRDGRPLITVTETGKAKLASNKAGQFSRKPVVTITMPQWLAEREGFA